MLTTRRFRFPLLPLFFLAFGKNTEAAISTAFPKTEEVRTTPFSKKEKRKKKRHILKKWKAKFFKKIPSKDRKNKFAKEKNKERRKNHYGRLGLLILLGGVLSLFLFDALFLFALLGSAVLGVIGLIEDEKKTAAIFALALPIAAILAALISVAANWDD